MDSDRWAKCMDAASRMFEIMDALPTVKEDEHPVHMENMRGDIELKNVSFEYEAGHPIIKTFLSRFRLGICLESLVKQAQENPLS